MVMASCILKFLFDMNWTSLSTEELLLRKPIYLYLVSAIKYNSKEHYICFVSNKDKINVVSLTTDCSGHAKKSICRWSVASTIRLN